VGGLTNERDGTYTPSMRIGEIAIEGPFVLAPLAGITDGPMRRLCRRMGASMVWTEMASSEGIVRDGEKTLDLLRFRPEERPIALQIFGSRPETMAAAAARIEALSPDAIDLNAGCPARKVVRSGAGSALMRDTVLLAEIAAAVVEAVAVPVTAKIRSGWDDDSINAPDVARALEDAGVEAVAVHPRTRAQGFAGSADWSVIRAVKDEVGIPVLGSGDIRTPADALAMLTLTSCDAAMIGRAAMGNPWIFRRSNELHAGRPEPDEPVLAERLRIAAEHLDLMVEEKGERRGVFEMRKHLVAYLRGFPGASRLRAELVRIEGHAAVRARLEGGLAESGRGDTSEALHGS